MKKVFVIGAGFSGAVVAERLASAGIPVVVVDRRDHIGGNSYSALDPETGIECHKYGSHIFHTSDRRVWEYVNNFSPFNSYRHRVLANRRGKLYPMPINLETIRRFFERDLSGDEAAEFIRRQAAASGIENPGDLEEKAVSLIGKELYEAFIYGYTAKQWGRPPRELPAQIINRIPVRYDENDFYFSDEFEGIPLSGYGALFEKMLDRQNIEVRLDTSLQALLPEIPHDSLIVYTGAADELCDYALGKLEWRSIHLEWEKFDQDFFQPCAVVNYSDIEAKYTRIHEFKYYHPERPDSGKTVIAREFSSAPGEGDEPAYPVPTKNNIDLQRRYETLAAEKFPNLILLGRLGRYRYMDMDDTVAEALDLAEQLIKTGGRV